MAVAFASTRELIWVMHYRL